MITNVFFDTEENSDEQRLYEELTIESIQINGEDVWYILRTMGNYDPLYGADDQSSYEKAYHVEMYLDNVMGFGGDREFMSKFAGLEIRDQVIFTMSRHRFWEDIGNENDFARPREGDLIYFPLAFRIFQIKYVNQWEFMLPLGKNYLWQMTCELFEYSGEKFNTGIPDIDNLQKQFSMNILDYVLKDTDGVPLMTEANNYLVVDSYDYSKTFPLADNTTINTEEEDKNYIDWSELDPFSEDIMTPNTNPHII